MRFGAIIRETVHTYAARLDDFRLAFLHAQIVSPGTVRIEAQQLARAPPVERAGLRRRGEVARQDWKHERWPRAHQSPVDGVPGEHRRDRLLTFKGLVESVGDPLIYSDEELTEGLARIFEAAAKP